MQPYDTPNLFIKQTSFIQKPFNNSLYRKLPYTPLVKLSKNLYLISNKIIKNIYPKPITFLPSSLKLWFCEVLPENT